MNSCFLLYQLFIFFRSLSSNFHPLSKPINLFIKPLFLTKESRVLSLKIIHLLFKEFLLGGLHISICLCMLLEKLFLHIIFLLITLQIYIFQKIVTYLIFLKTFKIINIELFISICRCEDIKRTFTIL